VRALVANIQREDLGPIEEAQAYQRLTEMGWKVADVSRRTGKAAAIIYNRLKLLELEPEIQELIHTKRLSGDPRLCIALRKLPESQQRLEIARKAVERNLSIATVIKAVDVILARAEGKARKELGIQAVDQAIRIHGKEPDMPKWNAVAQAGLVLPWPAVVRASEQVCKRCILAISASDEICRECPAPQMLVQLMLTIEETTL
jgi:ParB-like chromosome segregation protein Spo0J